ncbi:hypothetical protein D9C73_025883 [Collichthys lucidus]|uniref:Uncharacterized protein n=1 Tax=Collichthys lucidus TaxID=240159 RepID=A0A4U5VT82_COLLU|nr:hypothetical protein D9C73_025883 [Collichthys lucidus]
MAGAKSQSALLLNLLKEDCVVEKFPKVAQKKRLFFRRAGLSGSEWRRATPRAQLYNSGQTEDYENVEELKQLCWRPSSLMGKDVWSSQLGFRDRRLLRTAPDKNALHAEILIALRRFKTLDAVALHMKMR